jgi:hypothetical protein
MRSRSLLLAGAVLAAVLAAYAFYASASKPERIEEHMLRASIMRCVSEPGWQWRSRCMVELGNVLSARFRLPDTLAALANIDEEPGIKQYCHTLVHTLGQNEYRSSSDLGTTFAACQSAIACGEGCFHGAVEGYLSEHSGSLSPSGIASVCTREEAGNDVNYEACNHGLGHAFMLVFENDLPHALELCDSLGMEERQSCYAGVFMENVFSAGSEDHPTTYIDPENPLYPCTAISDRYGDTCYSSQAGHIFEESRNFERVASFCESTPARFRSVCYRTIGSNAVLAFDTPEEIVRVCDLAPVGDARAYCLASALTYLGHGTAGDAKRLGGLCEAAHESDRRMCIALLGQTLEMWYPGKRAEYCERIGDFGKEGYQWCIDG